MKKIVIIGANDFQNPLILKAKEMGFETHVFAWQDGSIGEKTADFFYPISIVEKEEILKKCREINPDAVATIASDLANITVQYIAENLGLTHNSSECIEISTNKFKMRKALKAGGVKVPHFETVFSADELGDCSQFKFPVIVKPTDRSGSRGITKVFKKDELDQAVSDSTAHSFEKKAIVEEYIDGPEYSCECISYNGEHTLLTVTQKFTTGAPHFIETGHIEPSDLSEETLERVKEIIFKSLDALQIKFGASHSEFRVNKNGEIGIIEIGSRMGGDCIGSDLVHLSTGIDFVKSVIEVASGNKPSLVKDFTPKAAAIRFVFGNEDVEILENIKANHPESLHFVSELQEIGDHKIVDSGTRYGFYIMTAENREKLLEISKLGK